MGSELRSCRAGKGNSTGGAALGLTAKSATDIYLALGVDFLLRHLLARVAQSATQRSLKQNPSFLAA